MRSFRGIVVFLWLRFLMIAEIGVLLVALPKLLSVSSGWPYVLNRREMVFEAAVYINAVAIGAAVLGTIATALVAPLLLRSSSRERIAQAATSTAVALAAFVDFRVLLSSVLAHSRLGGHWTSAVFVLYYIAFAAVLLIPGRRKQLVGSLDGFLAEKTTRRAAIGLGVASGLLIAAERITSTALPRMSQLPVQRPDRNILLITFDALSAEDMSLYGYRLPTTPHIDDFARRSSVFANFYSASTFTTPSVASLLTGLQPSEHGVYHIPGRFPSGRIGMTLPHIMRAAGFATGAAISSPYVYFLNQDLAADYDVLPDMEFYTHDLRRLWNGTALFHQQRAPGNRAVEYVDFKHAFEFLPQLAETHFPNRLARLESPFPPAQSFAQGRRVLDKLPEGFFLWIHVMAPHEPYLPDGSHFGRFLHSREMRTQMAQSAWAPSSLYAPGQQDLVDKARLRYDEFVAEADDAFGAFMAQVEQAGRLRNTAVFVTSDHGESFQGGVYTHKTRYQTRPQIHIPLIIHMPGQETGKRVNFTADQTSLGPSMLEAAGLERPQWMRSESLISRMSRDEGGGDEGIAFTQYLETDSIFQPPRKGTVGVITGGQQYVIDLPTGKGILRAVGEAHSRDCDHSAENPELADRLRGVIHSRFPGLSLKSS